MANFDRLQYYMPVDEKEKERLDILHTMILAARPKDKRLLLTHFAEKEENDSLTNEPARVLDLGHGTGIWLLDMAKKHRRTRFDGVDLANMVPRYVHPNIDINPMRDYENPWALGQASFDLIHMQMGF
jgi:methylase of polypeptide subunit release factors